MNVNEIGIKLADGSFFPILTENVPAKKELELTTVRDNQTTVQVNLYKSETGSMLDSHYVDTLLIANLVPHKKGEPTIRLQIALDEQNMLSAEAVDSESGGSSNVTVSLVTLEDYELTDDVDFNVMPDPLADVSDTEPETEGKDASGEFSTAITDFGYLNRSVKETDRKSIAPIICIICAVVSLAVLGVMLYFYFSVPRFVVREEIVEAVPAPTAPAPELPKPVEAVEDKVVVVEAPVVVPAPPPVSPVKPQEVRYKIKWGDTLWDLADAYYKNPWLYKKIAQANKIKNPDYIISGTWIVIPPK